MKRLFVQIDAGLVWAGEEAVFLAGTVVIRQKKLHVAKREVIRRLKAHRLVGERTDHQQLLLLCLAGIDIQLVRTLIILLIAAVADDGQALAQGNGLFVEIQDRIRIVQRLFDVDVSCNFR